MAQRGHLAGGQVPELSGPQRLVLDRSDPDATQPHHGVPDRLTHVTHLAFPSLGDDDPHHRPVAVQTPPGPDEADGRRRRAATVEHDPAREPFQGRGIGHSPHPRLVDPLETVTRMGQARGQIAVVGQQQQPIAVVV